jgi:hypothetical protein
VTLKPLFGVPIFSEHIYFLVLINVCKAFSELIILCKLHLVKESVPELISLFSVVLVRTITHIHENNCFMERDTI